MAAAKWIAVNDTRLGNGTRVEGSFASGMEIANLGGKVTLDLLQRLIAGRGTADARDQLSGRIADWRISSDFLARVNGLG